ncbi:MAG TPA: hypothetical protein VHZ04_03550 [Candidatus Paceibacterota bacterium]|jgi:hypothetical protein|nr:hypothetical protein [Candidatus Paceibacterota bacterium]
MAPEERLEKEKELVLMRLSLMDPHLGFFEGDGQAYSRDEMIQKIKENDKTGLEYVRKEMNFLRALKSGEVLRKINQPA